MLHLYPDSLASGGASLFREALEHPFPPFPDGFHPNFPFGTQQDTSPWQAVRQDVLPSSDVPAPSISLSWEAAILFGTNMENRDSGYEGSIGAGFCVTGDTYPPVVIPDTPPVSFAQSAPPQDIPI